MLAQNHYLDLFKTKATKNNITQFVTEIAYMHNALGQVIKQLITIIDKNTPLSTQPNTSLNPQSKQQSQHSLSDTQNLSKNQKVFKPKALVQKYKTKSIDEIESDSSIENKSNNPFNSKRQVYRNKFSTQSNLNAFMEQQTSPEIKKAIYREGIKNNLKKQELQAVDCQVCKSFYGAVSTNQHHNKLCKHTSRHKTTAPFTKIRNFSQQFDDI